MLYVENAEAIKIALDAIVDTMLVLGTGQCSASRCLGCDYEKEEAVVTLRQTFHKLAAGRPEYESQLPAFPLIESNWDLDSAEIRI